MSNLNLARCLVEYCVLPGTNYRIAGGYPRDLYHKVTPKDVDYWVEYTEGIQDTIRERLNTLHVEYKEHDAYDSPEHDKRERVVVFGLSCGADIIISEEPPLTSVQKFDFNLNQFVLYSTGPTCVAEVHPRDGLVAVSEDVSPTRVQRIEDKWQALYGSTK